MFLAQAAVSEFQYKSIIYIGKFLSNTHHPYLLRHSENCGRYSIFSLAKDFFFVIRAFFFFFLILLASVVVDRAASFSHPSLQLASLPIALPCDSALLLLRGCCGANRREASAQQSRDEKNRRELKWVRLAQLLTATSRH
jgi:hypothetical protein